MFEASMCGTPSGPVGLCYLAGILVANLPYVGAAVDRSLSMRVSEVAVPLSIPLLLFATQLRSLSKLAGPTLLAFALAIIATLVSALLFGIVFKGRPSSKPGRSPGGVR